jgi:hypothetical protein
MCRRIVIEIEGVLGGDGDAVRVMVHDDFLSGFDDLPVLEIDGDNSSNDDHEGQAGVDEGECGDCGDR